MYEVYKLFKWHYAKNSNENMKDNGVRPSQINWCAEIWVGTWNLIIGRKPDLSFYIVYAHYYQVDNYSSNANVIDLIIQWLLNAVS